MLRRELLEKTKDLFERNKTDGKLTKAVEQVFEHKKESGVYVIKEDDKSFFYTVVLDGNRLKLGYHMVCDIPKENGFTTISWMDKTINTVNKDATTPSTPESLLCIMYQNVLDGLKRCDNLENFATDLMIGGDD